MANSGIYKITTLHNNEFYIGSAVNIHKREINHKCHLRTKRHGNRILQRVYNKYGEQNFKFEKLIDCPKEYLIKMEQWFIDTLNPKYNIKRTAESALGVKRTRTTCRRISKALTGRELTKQHKDNLHRGRKNYRGKIYQFDKTMNLIKEWDTSITNIARELVINRRGLNECLNKRSNSSAGFIWKFEKEVTNG